MTHLEKFCGWSTRQQTEGLITMMFYRTAFAEKYAPMKMNYRNRRQFPFIGKKDETSWG